jgi:hypothetical protein
MLHIIKPSGDTTITFNCRETDQIVKTIQALLPNTEYQYYLTNECFLPTGEFVNSDPTCIQSFKTYCLPISASENFDNYSNCEASCNVNCTWNSLLVNNKYSSTSPSWIISQGDTPTEATGPSADVSLNGKYIYIENNPDICTSGDSIILESTCMYIKSNGGICDMSFYYHMYGNDIQSLTLQISTDNGLTWLNLTTLSGEQGNQWLKKEISLIDYHQKNAIFRFVGITAGGQLGDIAIDEIQFFGSQILSGDVTYYIDEDNDGYGSEISTINRCLNETPSGYVIAKGDCDDTNPAIHPGAPEITCNAIDENCNSNQDDVPTNGAITYTFTVQDVSCAGQKDGTISLTIQGGQPPYTVLWNDEKNDQNRTKLLPGVYHATITDSEGCKTLTSFIELKAITTISIIADVIHPSCLGKADGAINITHSMDNPPYLYKWSGLDAITKNLTNLGEGKYTIIVTDAKGCVAAKKDITLVAKPSIAVDLKKAFKPRCYGEKNGQVELFVSNGIAPYTYTWNTGETTIALTNLISGQYSCTVMDNRGCKVTKAVDLTSPDTLEIVVLNVENVRCHGEQNGFISTKSIGGTPPYSYMWNYNSWPSDDIIDIPAGHYLLTVTDSKGCKSSTTQSITVSQPPQLFLALDSVKSARCLSGLNGYIKTTTVGGSPPYQYDWNHTTTSLPTYDNLKTGDYSVTAFDQLGCKSNNLLINVPTYNVDLNLSTTILQDNKCAGDKDGKISLSIQNGAIPFDINWSDGRQYIKSSKYDTLTQLIGGRYSVTVTDQEGCISVEDSIIIHQYDQITYTIQDIIQNQCATDQKALIVVGISGGKPPFDINWNNNQKSGTFLFNLSNGKYQAKITDDNGCLDSISTILLVPKSDIKAISIITHTVPNQSIGKICLTIEGGKEPYRVLWSNNKLDHLCIEELAKGTYYTTITDDLGCEVIDTFVIESISSSFDFDLSNQIVIYPNPSYNKVYIKSDKVKISEVSVRTSTGQIIYDSHNTEQLAIDISFLPSGVYIARIGIWQDGQLQYVSRKVLKL